MRKKPKAPPTERQRNEAAKYFAYAAQTELGKVRLNYVFGPDFVPPKLGSEFEYWPSGPGGAKMSGTVCAVEVSNYGDRLSCEIELVNLVYHGRDIDTPKARV